MKSLADEPLSIGLSKACIRRSDLLVATDSGPRHFAAAFDVPAISLFGPTDPRWSINYHQRETRLFHQVPCGPCAQRECPLVHHECMRGLRVERVYEAVCERLGRRKVTAQAA
jgi:heptosyltransferase-2